MQIEPFRIAVPEDVLVDLRTRLARTRFPDEIRGSGWRYGTDLAYLRELVAYWRDRYDWRAEEARLNQLHHFRARVGGLAIHFIHERGVGPRPLPLVVTHGWPGSVAEFTKIIPLLTDPGRHGGDPADAFDVVVPSMPGYGFSERPSTPGMDPERIAALWAELMSGLGYARFGAQGGDWGAIVSTYLGARHAEAVVGVHLNMVVALPPDPANPADGLPAHPRDEAADARLRAQRLAGRARGLDRREVPHLERLRRRRRAAVHQGRAAHQRHALLGHRDRHVVVPALLRGDARREVPADRAPRRGADGVRDLPRGDRQTAATLGRARLRRQALDRDALGRALRRDGGARGARRRHPCVLPAAARLRPVSGGRAGCPTGRRARRRPPAAAAWARSGRAASRVARRRTA